MLKVIACLMAGAGVGLGVFGIVAGPGPAGHSPRATSGQPSLTASHTAPAPWVATWAASAQPPADGALPTSGFTNQTVREVIYASAGGSALRVRLSNVYGARPLRVGEASAGTVLSGAAMESGMTRTLTFGGSQSVTIPAHGTVTSDAAAKPVTSLTELAISIFLPDATGPLTSHLEGQQDTYAASGNHATDRTPGAFTTVGQSSFLATEVDVQTARAHGTVVAFGDSITDGLKSTPGGQARWPNYLARRLAAAYGPAAPGVVDEGLTGNRLLSDACGGPSGLARFQRDALGVSGVRAVVLLEGINDLGYEGQPNNCGTPVTVTAAAIENGYRSLITLAHAHGVKVYLGTLTPNPGLSAQGQEQRTAVNNWILGSHAAGISDGVVGFSAAVADPLAPTYPSPPYNSGDNLHLDDLGYETMASAIPVAWLK
ncbi:MAG TPA: GDSL-type esterase/lipase family protein [Trebonia sp.]|nr:GDSL-type esterase/lipase family protein [Trebonia sp.]